MAKREDMQPPPPMSWRRLADRYPDVASAYNGLRQACDEAGSLDPKVMALVKLALSVGARSARTVHAHARKAMQLGVAPADLRQVAVAALPTVGRAAALDALKWVDESIEEHGRAT